MTRGSIAPSVIASIGTTRGVSAAITALARLRDPPAPARSALVSSTISAQQIWSSNTSDSGVSWSMLSSAARCASTAAGFGRKAARRHGLGIGQRDHAVDGDARADLRPVERLQQRLRQRQARGLDQDVIGPHLARQQRLDGRDEVVGHRAADAAIGQLDDVLLRTIGVGAGFQDLAVDAVAAELVDQHGELLAAGIRHQMPDQRGLAGAEKAGDHGDGDFRERTHSAASDRDKGGIRASDCLRKISGRARQGTRPSGAAA